MAAPRSRAGPEGFKSFLKTYRDAFPDTHIEIHDYVADDTRVVTRWTGTGTHLGESRGWAPTEKKVEYTEFGSSASRSERSSRRGCWDTLGMMRQLGVIPPPKEPGH